MTDNLSATLLRIISAEKEGKDWVHVKVLAIEALSSLSSVPPHIYKGVIIVLFRWLFSYNIEDLHLARALINGKLGACVPIMALLKQGDDCNDKDATNHHTAILKTFSQQFPKLRFEHRLELLTFLLESYADREGQHDWFSLVVLPLVLGELVKSESVEGNRLLLAETVFSHVDERLKSCILPTSKLANWPQKTSCILYKEAGTIRTEENVKLVNLALSKEFNSLLFCLGSIIDAVKWKSVADQECDPRLTQLSTSLFDVVTRLANESTPCQAAFKFWYQTNFVGNQRFPTFLVETLSNCIDGTDKDTVRLIRCIKLLRSCLSASARDLPDTAISSVVPTLLLVLQSQYKVVRRATLQCLAVIYNSELQGTYALLLAAVLEQSKGIENDQSYINEVLVQYFYSADEEQLQVFDVILKLVATDAAILDTVKCGILSCLAGIQSEIILIPLIPLLASILESKATMSLAFYMIARSIIKMFCPATTGVFVNSPQSLPTLRLAFQCDESPPQHNLPTLQVVALNQVTKDLFKALPDSSIQQSLLRILIDEKMNAKDATASRELSKILKRLLFNGDQILVELQHANVKRAEPAKTVKGVKLDRRKQIADKSLTSENVSSNSKNNSHDDSVDNLRVTIVLEAIQHKRRIEKFQVLIPTVFGYLQRVHEASRDYETQLVLENLISFCNQLLETKDEIENEILSESHFHVESIVSCIRGSRNPRIHQHALQLLAVIAQLFPEHVLHNIMAIFTFMGNNALRQDDSYSFDVIIQTVQNVVPPIMANCKSKLGSDQAQTTSINLSRIFVDALPDIAQHRRIALFKSLLAALEDDAKQMFHLFSLIMQRCVTWSGNEQEKSKEKVNTDRRSMIDFALQFCNGFQLKQQLGCCINLIEQLNLQDELRDESTTATSQASNKNKKEQHQDVLFQLQSPSHIRHHRLIVVEFISSLLSSPALLSRIVDSSPADMESVKMSCPDLLKEMLNNIRINQGKDEKDSGSAKYWKVLQHRSLELCDRVIALLSDLDFVAVIEKLISDDNISIRRKALEMLSAKLQQNQKGSLSSDKAACFLTLLPPLLEIVTPSSVAQLIVLDDLLVERQIAFFALRHLCHLLAPAHSEQLNDVVTTVMTVVRSKDEHEGVLSGAILCLAELCRGLRSQMIPHLPQFMPALTKIVEDVPNIFRQELLLLSAVTAIHRTVDVMSQFLSPYLPNILFKVCEMSILCPENPKSPFLSRLASIRQNISKKVMPRVLYPIVQSCYHQLVNDQKEAPVKFLMTVLGDSIGQLNPTEAATWQEFFLPFFLDVFDYRLNNLQRGEEQIAVIEESVMVPILALVPKLSETTFRPFFIKFFDWATRPDAPFERCIVFYSVADKIADKLKSLFVLFAGLFIKHSATMLDLNNTTKTADLDFTSVDGQKRILLLKKIIDCLHKCFLHDNERFVNKERFDTLLHPMVDQIENNLGSDSEYENLILNHLKVCLAQLAVASAGEMLWKQLNHAVLIKTRSSSSKVRFAALQVLRDIASKIGEDYMTVIPEAIPFLAELLEDESVEVENLCQAVIQDLETVLGEPMQKYF